jgi:hypothetical protein
VQDATIAAGAAGNVMTDGVLSNADWTTVLGTTALTAGSLYFLDPATAGKITATPPTTAGQYAVSIGRALNTTDLLVKIRSAIGL